MGKVRWGDIGASRYEAEIAHKGSGGPMLSGLSMFFGPHMSHSLPISIATMALSRVGWGISEAILVSLIAID
jgi:hypothetical protein